MHDTVAKTLPALDRALGDIRNAIARGPIFPIERLHRGPRPAP